MLPVAVKVPVEGLYSSAVAVIWLGKPVVDPPATKTVPFGSKVAV
jgi:hypothetical protein